MLKLCVRVRTIRNSVMFTRTQVFGFFSHIFLIFTETLRATGRVSTHPAHSIQRLRATGRAARCAAPTRLSLLNQRNLYDDNAKKQTEFIGTETINATCRGGTPAISCAVRETLVLASRARCVRRLRPRCARDTTVRARYLLRQRSMRQWRTEDRLR